MSSKRGMPPLPRVRPEFRGLSSNTKLLLIAASFLIVTIGLILLQPGSPGPQRVAAANVEQPEEGVAAPVSSLRPPSSQDVTRNAGTLLSPVALPSASEAVSRQLRQPIRLTDTNAAHRDLPSLTAAVLSDFGHVTRAEDRLQTLLVQALSERQSNAYIDAILNSAAKRGEFTVPPRLARADGRLDTMTLLAALVQRSEG